MAINVMQDQLKQLIVALRCAAPMAGGEVVDIVRRIAPYELGGRSNWRD